MKFITEEVFLLQPIFKLNGKPKNKSKVFINRQITDYIVDGIVLDECIQIYSHYLLIVSYYSKDDKKDGLFFYLFNEKGDFLEEIRISVIVYHPLILPIEDLYEYEDSRWGYLSNISLFPPNIISFKLGNNYWGLEVFKSPLFSWSLLFGEQIDECVEGIPVIRSTWQCRTYFKFMMVPE